ncbi:glycosyl hydrolase family 18 protein [Psychromonas aquimarina]|uniref:glycosyl hydrolase family 18 protein n=1 Tax=Psychromonas aquimarina TaxID=444919 RepID=UPI000402EBA8|nr:glycosyl hydrolase family 18 protein [Psychromonas aquimarina]
MKRNILAASILAAFACNSYAAAPSAPSLAWADYSKLGFVTLNTDATVGYKSMYTRVDVVEVPVAWNVWSGDKATSWQVLIDGEVAVSGTGQGDSAVIPFTSGGLKSMVVKLCNADGCSESAPTELLISDTDGSHLQADLPMSVDPANTPYAQQKDNIVGTYFVEWGVYGRKFNVNDIPANNLTHIIYGFVPICGGTGDNQSLKDPNPKGHALLKTVCSDMNDYEIVIHDSWAALNSTYGTPAKRLDGKAVGSLEIGKGNYGNLMALKKAYPHLKIVPSIGGWTLSDPFFGFTDKANRDTFVASAKEFLQTWKFFDGIDIDWEFPGGGGANASLGDPLKDGPAYVALMQELRAMLDELEEQYGRKYELTSAIGVGYDKLEDVDYAAASQYMDNIFMMSYDFYGAWGPETGHQTAIYCGAHISADKCNGVGEFAGKPEYTLDNATKILLAQGVTAKKLVVGAAMYARGWTDVVAEDGNPLGSIGKHVDNSADSPFTGSTGTGTEVDEAAWAWEAGIMDYRGALKFSEANSNAITGWDDVAKASFIWDDVSSTLLTLDTPRSVLAKGDYLRSLGLGGIFSWEIDGDGNGDILNAMNQAVGNPQGTTDWSTTTPAENKAPSVSISSPTSGARLTAGSSALFSGNANDSDGTLTSVIVTLNGNTLAATVNGSAYTADFTVALGDNLLVVKATDNEGAVTTKSVTFTGEEKPAECTADQILVNGVCEDKPAECTADQVLVNGVCEDKPAECTADQVLVNGVCEDKVVDSNWDASAVYNSGDQVTVNGVTYRAGWWTKGDNPEQSGEWGVWKKV